MFFFFSSRRRHTRYWRDWSSDVCSSDLHLREDGGKMLKLIGQGAPLSGRNLEGYGGLLMGCGLVDTIDGGGYACQPIDWERVGEGKSVDLGGRRIIKKKKKK